MARTIRLGISTCPNDTYAFAALIGRRVDWRGLDFQVELLDIQELNDRLFAGQFDVAKCSFHAALLLAEDTVVLPSGSALGFGVGPLLLASRPGTAPGTGHGHGHGQDSGHGQDPGHRHGSGHGHGSGVTLCPGRHTTATLLFRLFYGPAPTVRHVRFSDIMPELRASRADFGVCIHEGRFTWRDQGLDLVEDLGGRWEQETSCPLPLGGIIGRRALGTEVLETAQAVIADSLRAANDAPESALPVMREHAQEFDDAVLMKHVELYVNPWTEELGEVGQNAFDELNRRAKSTGLVPADAAGLRIL